MSDRRLTVSGISAEFAGLRALNDVSLALRPGEILGLIGPNGSGKTTLVNVLTGHVRPSAGQVHCAGRNITGELPRRIAPMISKPCDR